MKVIAKSKFGALCQRQSQNDAASLGYHGSVRIYRAHSHPLTMPELCATTGVPQRTLRIYVPKLHSGLATFRTTYSIDNVSAA